MNISADAQLAVYRYLGPVDLARMRAVCRGTRVVASYGGLWQKHLLQDFPLHLPVPIERACAAYYRRQALNRRICQLSWFGRLCQTQTVAKIAGWCGYISRDKTAVVLSTKYSLTCLNFCDGSVQALPPVHRPDGYVVFDSRYLLVQTDEHSNALYDLVEKREVFQEKFTGCQNGFEDRCFFQNPYLVYVRGEKQICVRKIDDSSAECKIIHTSSSYIRFLKVIEQWMVIITGDGMITIATLENILIQVPFNKFAQNIDCFKINNYLVISSADVRSRKTSQRLDDRFFVIDLTVLQVTAVTKDLDSRVMQEDVTIYFSRNDKLFKMSFDPIQESCLSLVGNYFRFCVCKNTIAILDSSNALLICDLSGSILKMHTLKGHFYDVKMDFYREVLVVTATHFQQFKADIYLIDARTSLRLYTIKKVSIPVIGFSEIDDAFYYIKNGFCSVKVKKLQF